MSATFKYSHLPGLSPVESPYSCPFSLSSEFVFWTHLLSVSSQMTTKMILLERRAGFSGRRRTLSRHYQLNFLNVALDPSLKLAKLSPGWEPPPDIHGEDPLTITKCMCLSTTQNQVNTLFLLLVHQRTSDNEFLPLQDHSSKSMYPSGLCVDWM